MRKLIAQVLQQIQPGASRHANVANDDLRGAMFQLGQRFIGRSEAVEGNFFTLQRLFSTQRMERSSSIIQTGFMVQVPYKLIGIV